MMAQVHILFSLDIAPVSYVYTHRSSYLLTFLVKRFDISPQRQKESPLEYYWPSHKKLRYFVMHSAILLTSTGMHCPFHAQGASSNNVRNTS